METKEIFEKTNKLEKEILETKKRLDELNLEYLKTMELCPHEIVFKYKDNYPRKMVIDGTYLCPACGKAIKCFRKEDLKKTDFKESRIIPLTNLSLLGSNEMKQIINEEVFSDMDLYYDYIMPIEELTSRMEAKLQDKQVRYESQEKVLIKTRRKN